jgi:hypothetical protein
MSRKFTFILMIVILSFLAIYPQPIQASTGDTAQLIITNATAERVTLQLSGPKKYTFYVNPGKNTFEMLKGVYTYNYTSCGTAKTGKMVILTNFKFKILICQQAKLRIQNWLPVPITVTLQGAVNYTFQVAARAKPSFRVNRGAYKITIRTGCAPDLIEGMITISGTDTVSVWACNRATWYQKPSKK